MVTLYDYDKNYIKENLTIDNIFELLAELGGDPIRQNDDILISITICHGGDSHKLYYYDNTKLFHCFTGCDDSSFDIFELVRKVKSRELGVTWELPFAIDFVAQYFGYSPIKNKRDINILDDWKIFSSYDRIKNINPETKEIELKEYDKTILQNLPQPIIVPWIKDNISKETMELFNIRYDPINCGAVIPHYDLNNRLIGIRERSFVLEDIEKYGKYRPAIFGGKMYNHPLSYNLYGLNMNKDNIMNIKKAILFEAEKSVMQYETMFGRENNISVASCGINLITYQAWLLINLGIDELIIGWDKQFQTLGDEEYTKLINNLKGIYKKYGKYVKISFIFDKKNILSYKAAPIETTKENFLKLFKERIDLY